MPRKAKKDTPVNAGTQVDSTPAVATTETRTTNMSDLSSIIEFSEDISTAEAPPPLPDGDYSAEIKGAVRKTSSTSGNDYADVSFFIAPEEYPADYTGGNPDGLLLNYRRVTLVDEPGARYRTRKFCESIGAKMGRTLDLNDWVGLTATIRVGTSEYEGEKRNEIKTVVQA